MRPRVMLVGPRLSGKATIATYLEQSKVPLRKVDNIVYRKETVTVPDNYLECPWMYNHIIALQQTAKCGLFIQPMKALKNTYPPNFAKVFRIPIFGIITYHDSYTEDDYSYAEHLLMDTGIKQINAILNLDDPEEFKQLSELLN
ncbi:EutP/PduV family microcompartment system protein [Companilactobacillus sp. HBUAS59699]|uniref:EutP/PduV family microcompartment system protein n=1 Tax=Companilactobacillus sp. HBUAS59699 TaxID=3109358 RepID=UPI002FF09D32